MADQFSAVLALYKAQLQTISDPYFPAVTGRAAGWQVSENDLIPMEGSEYFIVLRPGAFQNERVSAIEENEWHVTTRVFMRFAEYNDLWPLFRAYRSAILELPKTVPIRGSGIWRQTMVANGEPGFIVDTKSGNFTDLVAQDLDCTIRQRVKIR